MLVEILPPRLEQGSSASRTSRSSPTTCSMRWQPEVRPHDSQRGVQPGVAPQRHGLRQFVQLALKQRCHVTQTSLLTGIVGGLPAELILQHGDAPERVAVGAR